MLSSVTFAFLRIAVAAILPVESDPPALFITSSPPHALLADCLRSSYYGTFGGSPDAQDLIYLPTPGCLASSHTLDGVKSGSIVPLPLGWSADDGRIVWVGQAGVDERLVPAGGAEEMMRSWELISERSWSMLAYEQEEQEVVISSTASRHVEPVRLLHATTSSLLLQVPNSFMPILDTLLPPFLVPVALPRSPLPTISGWDPVPSDLAGHLANLTAHLDFSPQLDRIVSIGIDLDDIRRNVRWLTGEAPSGFQSRHSFTDGAVKAAHWIKSTSSIASPAVRLLTSCSGKVEPTGARCSFHHFMPGFAPNVLCRYPSLHNSTEQVILSAHYDSRGSWGMTRAPGGDDDGSGTGHLLAVAEAIGSQSVEFEKSVTLAFFAGEEQGLIGSNAYAGESRRSDFRKSADVPEEYLHAENATVIFQLQADMLAYHDVRESLSRNRSLTVLPQSGEPLQMGLPESWVPTYLRNVPG